MTEQFKYEIRFCENQIAAMKTADNNNIEKYKYLSRFYGSKYNYEQDTKSIIHDLDIFNQPGCESQLLRVKSNQIEIKDWENILKTFEDELKNKGWLN